MDPIIIKISDASHQDHGLKKLVGNVPLSSFVEIISAANLDANPRLAKVSHVTREIEESLETQPETFPFMSKGVLIAAAEVEELDRSRYRLTFNDPELEGVLDGGHNTLAIGRHILRLTLKNHEEDDDVVSAIVDKIKTWENLKVAWKDHRSEVLAEKGSLPDTLIPIEVIYPGDTPDGVQTFLEKVLMINAARNNNAELTVATKANKKGYYSEIKEHLDPALIDEVEWKANDGGRIKVRDLVALSLIPLSKLESFKSLDQVRKNPSVIFSSKGTCLQIYNDLMAEKGVTSEVKGGIVEISHPDVKNALKMVGDLPRLFDLLYERMPYAYNGAGGKFAKIESVKGSTAGKAKYKTRYYKKAVAYSYGEGYIYPLFYGLRALMKYKDGELSWMTDPYKFIDAHLEGMMKSFYSMIVGQGFDPAKVGKLNAAYNLALDLCQSAYRDELFKEHGLDKV